jgi:imidazolonepropionase-like amidohydrolase
MTSTLLVNGTVIDGTGAAPRAGASVLLADGRIRALGEDADAAARTDPEVRRIDATGHTVMPGLIDAHCHVTLGEPRSNDELFHHRDEASAAILAAFNAPKILRAGVTGMLDADCVFNVGPALRTAIDAGLVEGPRMVAGANALMTSVGGTAGNMIPDEGRAGYAEVVGDREGIVRAVRRQVKRGADWIKVHVTGRAPRHERELQVWTLDELRIVVETAHDLETPVVGHCRSSSSTRDAAIAGFDLIYHASFMEEDALEALVEHRTPIAPTFTFLGNLSEYGHLVGAATDAMRTFFNDEIEQTAGMVRRAYDAGVPLLAGSESGFSITPYGHWHARELELFVKYLGLTPLEAITTATGNGAIAMRMPGEVGTLEPGRLADVLVIDGDPLADIRVLGDRSRIRHLFKGGRAVELDRPWPERDALPGEKVFNWSETLLESRLVGSHDR